jgi:hypothetical protein
MGTGDLLGYCEQAARELAEKKDRAAYLPTLSKMLAGRESQTNTGRS